MDTVMRRKQSFLLRLPASLREQANQLAHDDGISLNQFISLAVSEKICRMEQQLLDHPEAQPHPPQNERHQPRVAA